MKNILKYILSFAFCVGVIFATTTTVNAEDKPISYATVDINQGETYYYYMKWSRGSEYQYQLADNLTYTGTGKMALYLVDTSKYPMYIREASTSMSIPSFRSYSNFETCENYGSWPIGNGSSYTNLVLVELKTNIPIFASQDMADQYRSGSIGIEKALNYKKISQNGSWVRPFEDIEINDSDILVPDLSNISHEGFTVTNCNNELYVCEIYMESGIEKPENYMNGSLNVDNALFVNSFGLITDNSEAYWNGPTFNIAQLYGIDNYNALMNSVNNFYSSYPSPNSYYSGYKASDNFQLWGQPFGKQGIFFMNSTSVSSNDLIGITPYDIPICYTQYRVRYFYYDDNSGYHYGPWGIYTYFSDGSVSKSGLFQSNTGDIIEIPTTSGIQNESGNIDFNTSNIVDLNNPNELFGYLRSTINNINATGNTFMTLFATLFSFIPIELQIALWLGIACMIFIGVIKSI